MAQARYIVNCQRRGADGVVQPMHVNETYDDPDEALDRLEYLLETEDLDVFVRFVANPQG